MKPLIILEMANNHMGFLSHGKKIIDQFYKIKKKYHNIDFAFKFQFRNLENYIHEDYFNSDHAQVKRFLDTGLKKKEWSQLINYAKKKFLIICTPFDEKSVDKVIQYKFDYLKIASCSVDEWPLLEYIFKKAKKYKIICSVGGASIDTISKNFSFFNKKKINIKYLYCVAKYPTEPSKLNLDFFKILREKFGDKICGFSTHELPDEYLSGSIAYSMGARIFEKHVNIKTKKFKINKYSSTPDQLDKWLHFIDQTIIRIGSQESRNSFLKEEQKNLLDFKRGAFLKKGLYKKKGEKIMIKDIDLFFPLQKNQITANQISNFSDFTAKKNILSGKILTKSNLSIISTRTDIEKIRDQTLSLIKLSGVIIDKNSKLEISHHYGIKNFYRYGICMLTIVNTTYCKKLIFMFNKQKHPAQFHKKKQETFFILFGKIKLVITKRNKVKFTSILNTGDIVTLSRYDIHEFQCVSKNGSVIEELSTTSINNDSFYLDNKINKNNSRKSFISLK
jgi:N-acetylneuraminate synthase